MRHDWTHGRGPIKIIQPTPGGGFPAAVAAAASWQPLPVGGGGYQTGIDIANDGSMAVRIDVNGGYVWDGVSQWTQVVTSATMPSSFVTNDFRTAKGTVDLIFDPSNSQRMWMVWGDSNSNASVLKSTNKGSNWTTCTMPSAMTADSNNTNRRLAQQHMAVDPQNSDVLFIGTQQGGLWTTSNGTSSPPTLTIVSTAQVPVGGVLGTALGNTPVAFAPTAPAGVVGGKTQTIYCGSQGFDIYMTVNGGTTWSAISNPAGINTPSSMVIQASTGNMFCTDGTNILRFVPDPGGTATGTWSTVYAGAAKSSVVIAINPLLDTMMACLNNIGHINMSYTSGASGTWTGPVTQQAKNPADIPWFGTSASLSSGGLSFSPLVSGLLWASDGIGVWYYQAPVPSGFTGATSYNWTSQTRGIESLEAVAICSGLTSSAPVLGCEDVGTFYLGTIGSFPTTGQHIDSVFGVTWAFDYAALGVSGFMARITDSGGGGYSTNNGSSWTDYPAKADFYNSAGGGCIACADDQSQIWAPAGGWGPSYTTDRGTSSWTDVDLSAFNIMTNNNIVAGSYDSVVTGDVTLTMLSSVGSLGTGAVFTIRNASGTGNWAALVNGTKTTKAPTSGTTVTYHVGTGLGAAALTAGLCTGWFAFGGQAGARDLTRTVAADRVAATTYYLFIPFYGVFKSTNGGVGWTQVDSAPPFVSDGNSGAVSATLKCPPKLGSGDTTGHVFYSVGTKDAATAQTEPFYFNNSGGSNGNWTQISNVTGVSVYGFGKPKPGNAFPTIFIIGYVSTVYGTWRSDDYGTNWVSLGGQPQNTLAAATEMIGDPNTYGVCYVSYDAGAGFYRTGP